MAVRITHTNNSSGHDGTYVYRSTSPMDPQSLPAPIADEPPVAPTDQFEYIDSEPESGDYYYRTQDYSGAELSDISSEVLISIAPDFSGALPGDFIDGGYFTAIMLDPEDDSEYALITSPSEGQISDSSVTYSQAQAFVTALDVNDKSDWSIPTIDESIMQYRAFKPSTANNRTDSGATDRVDPPLDNYTSSAPAQTSITIFQGGGTQAFTTADYYWTSDEATEASMKVKFFSNGWDKVTRDKSLSLNVRAVRRVYL